MDWITNQYSKAQLVSTGSESVDYNWLLVDFRDDLIYRAPQLNTASMSTDEELAIAKALQAKTIAMVGFSRDPAKPSREVAAYLKSHGYNVVPINPTADEILGEKCYRSLLDLPENLKAKVEVVDIFRRAEDVAPIVDQAVELHKTYGHLNSIWMQLGIVDEDSAARARKAGLGVVMNHCIMVEHRRRLGQMAP